MTFGVFDFFQKNRMKTTRHGSKKNSFVCFLEEFEDTKNHFEINWPLVSVKNHLISKGSVGQNTLLQLVHSGTLEQNSFLSLQDLDIWKELVQKFHCGSVSSPIFAHYARERGRLSQCYFGIDSILNEQL